MKRNHLVIVMPALVAASLICGALISNGFRLTAKAGQIARDNKYSGEKWEYCSIKSIGSIERTGDPFVTVTIDYFQTSGLRRESIETPAASSNNVEARERALAKAFAKLGSEGWDFVGEATFLEPFYNEQHYNDPKALYFKRRQK